MIVIAMTVTLEDIYDDYFVVEENSGVQHEILPGT